MIDTLSKHLAVIVLNYRTPAMVIDCLETLETEISSNDSYEVIVVDNCSGDDSADVIESTICDRDWTRWARVERSPINGGFAAGNNVGINATNADFVLLLNSDTLVRPGAIETLMRTMSEDDDLHLLGPRLEWPDGGYQVSSFRARTPITEMIAASRLGPLEKLFPKHVVARPLDEQARDLGWVSFACVLIRREVINRIGLLDEQYFMYFEDMAYCHKARSAGFTIGYQPAARVVHLRGGSSPVKEQTKQRKRRPKYFYAARAHYFRSTFGFAGYIAANLLWTTGWLLGSLRGKNGAVANEYRDIWSSPKHSMGAGGNA